MNSKKIVSPVQIRKPVALIGPLAFLTITATQKPFNSSLNSSIMCDISYIVSFLLPWFLDTLHKTPNNQQFLFYVSGTAIY